MSINKNKTEYLVWGIFFAVGMLFLIIGTVISIEKFNYDDIVETKGVISDITVKGSGDNTTHTVTVKYYVDGMECQSILGSYSSSYRVGKTIEMYYHEDNIYDIGTKSSDKLFLLFPGFGLLFALIGGIGLYVLLSKKSRHRKLIENGRLIQADYIETTFNRSYTVNGRHPYIIICKWISDEDGMERTFESQNLWDDPQEIIESRGIVTFPVYLNTKNPKKYYLDIREIEEIYEDTYARY